MGNLVNKAVNIGSFGLIDDVTGMEAAQNASLQGAELAAQGQREALGYLKEKEALPLEMRDQFLPQLGDIYSGGQGQQQLIDSAMNSPLYQQMIGNIEGGTQFAEDAMLRNRSATGGLRSGGSIEDMARLQFEQQNAKNAALTQTYGQQLQGIQGLANMPLNTNTIAGATAAPFQTQAQGLMGAAQAEQDVNQGIMNLGGAGMLAFSDIRLKRDIRHVGEKNGYNWYTWTWGEEAKNLGLKGRDEGVLAHEVYAVNPDAIGVVEGNLVVDYSMLGVQ